VKIGLSESTLEDYADSHKPKKHKTYLIKKLLDTKLLQFDAYVLDTDKLYYGAINRFKRYSWVPSHNIEVHMSTGVTTFFEFHQALKDKTFECLVIGTYGEPRPGIFSAMKDADKQHPSAKTKRIQRFGRGEPDGIACIIVKTRNGISHRVGFLRVTFSNPKETSLKPWDLGQKRSFILK
jgi:hypothetical protein